MTERFMAVSCRALCGGLCAAVMFTTLLKPFLGEKNSMSLFFPQLVLGGAIEVREDSEDNSSQAEQDDVEYTFFIAELFHKLFG